VAAFFLAVCSVAACGFLYLLACRLFSVRAGLLAITPLLFTPYAVSRSINGLETSLYVLLVCATSLYYLTRFRVAHPGGKTAAGVGVLAGLTVWARLDGGFFVLAMALDQLLLWARPLAAGRRRDGAGSQPAARPLGLTDADGGKEQDGCPDGRSWLAPRAIAFGIATLMVLPWLGLNWRLGDSIVPESGRAVRFLSGVYGGFADGPAPAAYYVANLREMADVLLRHFLTDGWFFGWLRQALGAGKLTFYGSCAGLALVLACWLARAHRLLLMQAARRWWERMAAARFLLLFCGLLTGAYAFYAFGPWFYGRYLLVVAFVLALLLAGMVDLLLATGTQSALPPWLCRAGVAAFAVLVLASAGTAAVRTRQAGGVSPWCTEIIPWLEQHLPEHASVGSFQAGYLAYFGAGRPVHALDGVVNGAALMALQQRRLIPYLQAAGVDYVVDWRWLTEALLYGRSPAKTWPEVTPTHVIPGDHTRLDFIIYRVNR
jgi:dolichyl-phosphate-mannose-protein mannosyltransferase